MDERSMDVKTKAINLSEDVYFFLLKDDGIHLQSKFSGGIITLSKEELENLKKLTDKPKSIEVLYGKY